MSHICLVSEQTTASLTQCATVRVTVQGRVCAFCCVRRELDAIAKGPVYIQKEIDTVLFLARCNSRSYGDGSIHDRETLQEICTFYSRPIYINPHTFFFFFSAISFTFLIAVRRHLLRILYLSVTRYIYNYQFAWYNNSIKCLDPSVCG